MGSRSNWMPQHRLDGLDRDVSGASLGFVLTAAPTSLAVLALVLIYDLPLAWPLSVAAVALGALAAFDVQTHRLPNPATAALAGGGLAAAGILALAGQMDSLWPVLAGGLGYGILAVLEALPRGSIGGGDAKLIAALGIWTGILGWSALLPTLLGIHLVMVAGLLIGRARQGRARVAMGPWIAIGSVGSWALLGLLA